MRVAKQSTASTIDVAHQIARSRRSNCRYTGAQPSAPWTGCDLPHSVLVSIGSSLADEKVAKGRKPSSSSNGKSQATFA